jgi:hypothetical protein
MTDCHVPLRAGQTVCLPCPTGWTTGIQSTNCSMTCNSTNYKTNGECLPMKVCDLTQNYYRYLPTGNRECLPLTPCNTAKMSAKMPCAVATTPPAAEPRMCLFRHQYITVRETETSNRICTDHWQCKKTQYMYGEYLTDHSGIVIRNQTCREYHKCAVEQYLVVDGGKNQDRDNICDDISECNAG